MTALNPSQRPFNALVSQTICAFVAGVTRMAPDPDPFDPVAAGDGIEPLPEIDILDRLAIRSPPAAALPRVDPLADALLDVLRIGMPPYIGRRRQARQRLDDR